MLIFSRAITILTLLCSWISRSAASVTPESLQSIIDSQDLQKLMDASADGDSSSIAEGIEFTRVNHDAKYQGALDSAVSRFAQENAADSSTTNTSAVTAMSCAASPYKEYEEYQLAWRFLGFAIDCNYYGQYANHQRKMKSGDATGTACARVLMYAVYIDANYGDNGLDQYDFYNKTLGTWNGCSGSAYSGRDLENNNNNNNKNGNYNQNRNRCVKMDCHVSNSENFQLLGVFRNYLPSTWMEQLFKHEGVCVWGWTIYGNMKNVYKNVKPNMCVFVAYDALNLPYYVGWQPMVGGNLGLMLYADERCSEYYTGTVTVDNVCSNYAANNNNNNNNNKRHLKDDNKKEGSHPCAMYNYLDYFNYQMDEWKLCHPCTAYSPTNKWDCYDDAGYTNCLQCMKFRNKAGSVAAGMDLVKLASRQNGIAEINVCGTIYGSGGFGSSSGPITYSSAMEQSMQSVKLYTKLNKVANSSNTTTHRDFSTAFLVFGVFAFVVALFVIFDVQGSFTSRGERKSKKAPLLHELS